MTLGTAGTGHKGEIEAILTALGVPLDDPAAIAWLGIPGDDGMQAWAHRKHLGLRRHDAEFLAFWENVVAFLDTALDAFDAASVRALDRLDALLLVDPPGDAEVTSFMEEMPKSVVVLDHFAEIAPPSWLSPLRENGFAQDVPESSSAAEGDNTDQLRWPFSRYLMRLSMLPEHNLDATQAALDIADLTNPYVHIDLVEIALRADAPMAARFVPSIRGWLDANPGYLLVDRLAKLSSKLLEAGETDAGFEIAELLTDLGAPST